jgi:ParB family chromosome partitioning protein
MGKKGLGRGLEALLPAYQLMKEKSPVTELKVNSISPNSYQPRRQIDNEKLDELARSITEHGVVQPIVVRPLGEDRYQIVVGERRWRACQQLQLETIPAVIKEVDDQELSEIALVENIQREDLHALEEARAYQQLIESFGLTQEELARRLGKSRPLIANTLRLLLLPEVIQQYLMQELLTPGHARALLGLSGEEDQLQVARQVIEENLSVRETEERVRLRQQQKEPEKKKSSAREPLAADYEMVLRQMEERLSTVLGTRVKINARGQKGKVEIAYYSTEDLERILGLVLPGEEY